MAVASHVPRLPRTLIAALLLACLSACTHLPFVTADTSEQVRELLAQQQFYSALDLIDATEPDDAEFDALKDLREEVLNAIAAFEQKTLQRVEQLSEAGQWARAETLLDDAIDKVPASKPMRERRKQVQATIERELRRVNLRLARLRASSLREEIELLQQSLRYTDDETVAHRLADRQRVLDESRRLLLAEAQRHIDQQQWRQARDYASRAHQLTADDRSRQMLATIDSAITGDQLSRLEHALDNGELGLAKQLAASLGEAPAGSRAATLIAQLEQQVELAVLQLTRNGQHAYSKGDIERAIGFWQQALELAPDNPELQKRLQRAQSFRANYQRFKNEERPGAGGS